jgi:hypothetical protein
MDGILIVAADGLEELSVGTSLVSGADRANGAGEVETVACAWNVSAFSCSLRLLTACSAQTSAINNNTPAVTLLQDHG